jgi:hypothetical protein
MPLPTRCHCLRGEAARPFGRGSDRGIRTRQLLGGPFDGVDTVRPARADTGRSARRAFLGLMSEHDAPKHERPDDERSDGASTYQSRREVPPSRR